MYKKMAEPPDEIPQYIVDGLHRQGKESLRAIERYAAELREEIIEEEEQPVDESKYADQGEEVVDTKEKQSGTVVIKKVPCGKDACKSCPHGPYKYTVKRVDGKIDWTYHGPVNE